MANQEFAWRLKSLTFGQILRLGAGIQHKTKIPTISCARHCLFVIKDNTPPAMWKYKFRNFFIILHHNYQNNLSESKTTQSEPLCKRLRLISDLKLLAIYPRQITCLRIKICMQKNARIVFIKSSKVSKIYVFLKFYAGISHWTICLQTIVCQKQST